MREGFKHIKLKGTFGLSLVATGTTVSSQRELIDATNFITEHKIIPVISMIIDDLENLEDSSYEVLTVF